MLGKIIEFPGRFHGEDEGGDEGVGEQEQEKEEEPSKEAHLDEVHLTKMLLFLTLLASKDPSANNARNIAIRSELLETGSDAHVIEAANNSSQSDWTAHPSYYHAVIDELRKRNLLSNRQGK